MIGEIAVKNEPDYTSLINTSLVRRHMANHPQIKE